MVLGACDRLFGIDCHCATTAPVLRAVFAALEQSGDSNQRPVREYIVGPAPAGGFIVSDGAVTWSSDDLDDVIFRIDKAITLALQHERRDLFFLHSAVLALNGRAIALPAFPGTGKSTLTLALAQNGLEYLSDELAPVDLRSLTVEPYPHALCLKSPPPPPYVLPHGTLQVNGRFHVPVECLPTATRREPLPLAAIVFPRRDADRFQGLRPLTNASAATCLMAHLLNGLAHPHYGLDAAISLSQAVPCFEVDLTDLPAAVQSLSAL